MLAKINQCLLAKPIRIGLACFGEFNHLLGDDLVNKVASIRKAKGCTDHFVCHAHDARGLEIEFLAVQEWIDGHATLARSTGGSAIGLSATGAWVGPRSVMKRTLSLIRTLSDSN